MYNNPNWSVYWIHLPAAMESTYPNLQTDGATTVVNIIFAYRTNERDTELLLDVLFLTDQIYCSIATTVGVKSR